MRAGRPASRNAPARTLIERIGATRFAPLRQQVKALLQERAYIRVLAATASRSEAFASERCWSFYRLGCYRSVVDLPLDPRSDGDILAKSVSLAACGCGAMAQDLALRLDPDRNEGIYREACERIAAFQPGLALTLAERLPGHQPLKLALAYATGHRDKVDDAFAGAAPSDAVPHPDMLLLMANLAGSPAHALDLLNRYLAWHKLAQVTLHDAQLPVNVMNLKPAEPARARTVDGPLTSIVMTTFNSAHRLCRSVQSILEQSYGNIELIIVDDASTDGTVGIVQQIARSDPRVRFIQRTRNAGTFVSKNEGIRQAKGEFVTCHDSDDFAHRDRIARQVSRLLRDDSLVSSQSDLVRLGDDGAFHARQVFPLTRANTCSLLFRREPVLARAGLYEPVRTGADSEFAYRLKLLFGPHSALRIKRPLTFAAHRAGSLTTSETSGLRRGPMPSDRLDYWEAWIARHVAWQSRLWPRLTGRYTIPPLRP